METTHVNVLYVTIGDGSFGGVANFLYNFYSHMDHSLVHADFLYCGDNSMRSKAGDSALEESDIISLNILKRNNNGFSEYIKLYPLLKNRLRNKEYDIVHVNSSNLFLNVCVAMALKGRAKLILHSHNTQATIEYATKLKKIIKSVIRKPCQIYIRNKADMMFACSNAAGENLFGKKGVLSHKFRIIHNAIDLSRYQYNPLVRKEVRGEENRLIVGHVGRLTDQKNPFFLLSVFHEIRKLEPNSVLWMVGEGELKNAIEKRITDLGLTNSVRLMGRRDDVPDLLQAMDVFLFPSLYEGLSIVSIEAQAASLPIFASDSISPEHKVTELVSFLSLNMPASEWASVVVNRIKDFQRDRVNYTKDLIVAGYELSTAANELQGIYLSII